MPSVINFLRSSVWKAVCVHLCYTVFASFVCLFYLLSAISRWINDLNQSIFFSHGTIRSNDGVIKRVHP